jgi:hypothetical protein
MIPHSSLPWAVLLAVAIHCASSVSAQLYVEESFSGSGYTADARLNGLSGGIGFSGSWSESSADSKPSASGDYDIIRSGSLAFGSVTTAGNSLSSRAPTYLYSDLFRQINTLTGTPGTSLWIGYLFRKDSDGAAARDYFGLAIYGTGGDLFFGDPGEDTKFALSTAGVPSTATETSSTPVVLGNTAWLVVRVSFQNGNDSIQLFVNPDPNSAAPTVASAAKSNLDLGNILGIGILGGENAVWTMDEIRMGARFSDISGVPVTPVNTPPTLTDLADQTLAEDGTTGPLPFTIGDLETAASSLTLSKASSNTTLVPVANIVLGGSGANRTVTVTPAANQSGSATITVTVSDGTASTSDTFTLTVTPVNDSPTISDLADQTLAEDGTTGPLPFTIGDLETAASSLTLSKASSNTTLVPVANIVLGGSGANRTVTVTPAANQSGSAVITVTVSDGTASTSETFTLTVFAWEADVAPRPGGNGVISVSDWVQVGRFAAMLEEPAPGSEYRKADCAPRASCGNGILSVSDWVQAGRYAAAVDELLAACGPSEPADPANVGLQMTEDESPMANDHGRIRAGQLANATARSLRLVGTDPTNGTLAKLALVLEAQGDENALGCSLAYDPSLVRFVTVTTAEDGASATLLVNTNWIAEGRLGLMLSLPTLQTFGAGTRSIATLVFEPLSASVQTPVSFVSQPLLLEMADVTGNVLDVRYVDGIVVFGPTGPDCGGEAPRVTLSARQASDTIILSWPATQSDSWLEACENLAGGDWVRVVQVPEEIAGVLQIALPMESARGFWRLAIAEPDCAGLTILTDPRD